MKIISWNVNGINACCKNGFFDFLKKENADIYCFQEVKVSKDKLNPELSNVKNYKAYWSFSKKPGYSGLLIYSKLEPINIIQGINNKEIDEEARVLTLEFKDFYLINSYFPHTNRELSRLDFKLNFNKIFEDFCNKLSKKKPLVLTGDFNVAHKEIDLRNPKENQNNAGFTIQERTWFDKFLNKGYIDTFRYFNDKPENYTWWSYMHNARKRNIGWRIDYFVISNSLKNQLIKSFILKDVLGSDHCPISLEIKN